MANQVTSNASRPAFITKADIISNKGGKTAGLVSGVVRLQYYESILQDTIKATVIYADSGDSIDGKSVIEGLPLVGTEDFRLEFTDNNENIYIVPKSKIKHLGASAVDKKYAHQIELSRNWHWVWSKFYFNKKHYGFLYSLLKSLPTFFSAVIKYLFYFSFNKKKKEIYLHRAKGFLNSILGKKSFFRPIIKISDQENL